MKKITFKHISYCFAMLFIYSSVHAQLTTLEFFVDRTHHRDLRFWTEKKHYYFFDMVEYIPKSPSYEYIMLQKNLLQYNIKSIKISNDTMTFAELFYFLEENRQIIKITFGYCHDIISTHKYCNSEKIIIFEGNEIFVSNKIESNEYYGNPQYKETINEKYILDNNSNLIKSISSAFREEELPEITEINYLYDEAGRLIEAKSYLNDSLQYTLSREFFRDSIVETVNTEISRVFFISELNYLPAKEKAEMFASNFTVIDSIVYYNINDRVMYTVDVSLWRQIIEYRGSFVYSVMDLHFLYSWKPEDWIRLWYYDFMHPIVFFNYEKTLTSSAHDFYIYYEENLVAKKSGLIDYARYCMLYEGWYEREYICCKFKYEYEFYE